MNDIANIDLQMFLGLDAHVFWKNTDHVYQGCNDVVADFWDVGSPKKIKGMHNKHFAEVKDIASQCITFAKIEKHVITSEQPLLNIVLPPLPSPDNTVPVYLHANLFPLKNKWRETLGVFGVAHDVMPPREINCLAVAKDYVYKNSVFSQLTAQEKRILLELVTGCSVKIAAKKLDLSKRTVETHLENIKRKLNVNSKAELIMLCLTNANTVI